MILIKNGRVIDPLSQTDKVLDIVITNGIIQDVCRDYNAPDDCTVIDAYGMTVAPGFVDVHVHFRDPGFTQKEDLKTGCAAAARGGYTSVVCMANTRPVVDCAQTLEDILSRAASLPVKLYQVAAITKGMQGTELTDMSALLLRGAIGFSDDGLPLADSALVQKAMLVAKKLGAVLSFHEEEPSLIGSSGINRGEMSEKLGLAGAPNVAEDVLVARDCMLALATGARINIQHVSSGNSVELIRLAKKLGADVWAEATPHHFSLCQDAVLKHGANAKMNPPLRTQKDRSMLINGLKDGTIGMIATDHAPHTASEKSADISQAPSGIIGLETALSLGVTNLVRPGHLCLSGLIEKMSVNPARLYALKAGSIAPGADADIVIFDPGARWTPDSFASKSANSPFTDTQLYGRVQKTICRGEIVWDIKNEA